MTRIPYLSPINLDSGTILSGSLFSALLFVDLIDFRLQYQTTDAQLLHGRSEFFAPEIYKYVGLSPLTRASFSSSLSVAVGSASALGFLPLHAHGL